MYNFQLKNALGEKLSTVKLSRSETANITERNSETAYNPGNIIEEANILLMKTSDTKILTDLNTDLNTNYRHCLYKNRCRKGMVKQLFQKS